MLKNTNVTPKQKIPKLYMIFRKIPNSFGEGPRQWAGGLVYV